MYDTPLVGTNTIHPNNEKETTPSLTYTPAEQKYLSFRRLRMISARDIRDARRTEYDDMTFLDYYQKLKLADDQYVPPRKNEQDTSINLGTVRDKDTSLVEFAQSHDFEPIAQVYDEDDDILEELAETGEDMVKKSLLIELWKDKSKLIYRSMVAFGTALVQDEWVERWVINKTFTDTYNPGIGTQNAKWVERLAKESDGAQAKLYDLRKCYFGDIRKFFMNGPQGQPYFFTVEYESYDVVKQTYGSWGRFTYVPTYVTPSSELSSGESWSGPWTLRPITPNSVEIIKYYDPVANEFAITLNGIDMLPLMSTTTTTNGKPQEKISGFPLTRVSPSGAIPFAKYDLEPMHDFALSKSQPGKMRVSAEVQNMMMKAFIGMFKQKWKPTLGNKSGRMFGSEATDPGTVINDIRDGDLFPVLPNYVGAMPADFSFYELVNRNLDQNSVERSWQGSENGSGVGPQVNDKTATEDMNDNKAQSLKVASLLDGIISGNTQLYWLRMYNIQTNWTKPIDKQIDVLNKTITDKFRTISLSTEVNGGQKATKKIIMTKDTPLLAKGSKSASLKDSMDIHQQELVHQKKTGNEIRITHLNPELFAQMKVMWYFSCVPVPSGTDPLSYFIFAKQVTDAQAMFGPQSLNVKKLKHRFATKTGNDFDTFFLTEQELSQNAPSAPGSPTPPTGAPGSIPGKPTMQGQPSPAQPVPSSLPAGGLGSMMK